MKKRHIAMVIARYPPIIGGTELQCRALSQALVKRGHRVSVLTERHDPTLPESETQDGVAIFRFKTGGSPFQSAWRFGKHLSHWIEMHSDVELLHAHMLAGPAMAAFFIGLICSKPVVIKIAGAGVTGDIGTSQTTSRGQFKLWLFKRLAKWVVCPSTRTAEEMSALGIPKTSIRIIPNGVQTDRFVPVDAETKAKLRAKLSLGQTDLVALYVGRWAEGKGVEKLLSIWETAQKQPGFRWKLYLVISQPPPADQAFRLEKLGGSVLGVVKAPDPALYYQVSDLAILLSENEGMSNFLLEAMASGLPQITTPSSTIGSPQEATAWGWMMPPANPADILALLKTLQDNPVMLSAKGAAARHNIMESFSSDQVAGTYEQLYSEILS